MHVVFQAQNHEMIERLTDAWSTSRSEQVQNRFDKGEAMTKLNLIWQKM